MGHLSEQLVYIEKVLKTLGDAISRMILDNSTSMATTGSHRDKAINAILEEIYAGLSKAEINLKKLIELNGRE